jgi:hypothetical protein
MKKYLSCFSLLLFLGSLFILACGGSGSGGSDTPPLALDFTLPTNVINASSLQADSDTVRVDSISAPNGNALSEWAFRADKIISQINKTLNKVNNMSVKGIGAFNFKTAQGTVTGKISALSGDTTYTDEMVICLDGTLFHYLKWNADGTKVYSYRDHSIEPVDGTLTKGLKSEISYDSSNTASTVLTLAAYGQPWNVPPDVPGYPDSYLGEYAYATKGSDNTFTLKGVRSWEATARTAANSSNPFAGAVYFTGKIEADTSGSFLVYRTYNLAVCPGLFNESNTAAPGWCFDGVFAAAGTTVTLSNSPDPTATYWTDAKLKPIGIAYAASIKVVEAPTGKTCQ